MQSHDTGLSVATRAKLCAVFERFPQIDKVVLYGSRAKGCFKPGSDIDLTLYGSALTLPILAHIDTAIDELLLPYTVDLSWFDLLDHDPLRQHIERVGVPFYVAEHFGIQG